MRDAALWTHGEANVIGRGMGCASSGGLQLPKGGSVRLGIGKGSTIPRYCGPLGCGDWPRGMGGGGGGRSQGGEATDSCSASSAAAAEFLFLALFLTADLVFSSVLGRGARGDWRLGGNRGKREKGSTEY
jgi:hypothetical protein